MYSVVPLSPEALIAGVCQDHNTDVVDPVDVDIDFVLDACQNLIVVDSKLHICRFSHLSVQEYLERHWGYYDANALIAKVCLSLLMIQFNKNGIPNCKTKTKNSTILFATQDSVGQITYKTTIKKGLILV